MEDEKVVYMGAGMNAVIEKPIQFDKLMETISVLLQRQMSAFMVWRPFSEAGLFISNDRYVHVAAAQNCRILGIRLTANTTTKTVRIGF